jgi:hypothetical protein
MKEIVKTLSKGPGPTGDLIPSLSAIFSNEKSRFVRASIATACAATSRCFPAFSSFRKYVWSSVSAHRSCAAHL